MTSPDSPSLSPEIDMDKVLKRLAHGGGPFDFDDDVQIINWLANRELFRRAPALSEGEPTPAATDFKKLLDEWEELVPTPRFEDADAARRAIELSFATLTEEIKRLKLWIPDCDVCGYPFDEHDRKNGYCFHGGIGEDATSYEPKPSEELAHASRTLRSENERLRLDKTGLEQWKELAQKDLRGLRATALTPEEASYLEDDVHLSHQFVCGFWHDEACNCLLGTISDKLRALSGETPK